MRETVEQNLVDRPILVWYDEEGALGNIVGTAVPEGVNFVRFEGSYLAIRAKIESEDPKFRLKWLVYVEDEAMDRSWIRDYELLGKRLDLGLERILVDKFALVLDSQTRDLIRGERGKLLAANWREVIPPLLRVSKDHILRGLLSIVFGLDLSFSLDRAILEYVTYPERYEENLKNLQLYSAFADMIRMELGLDLPDPPRDSAKYLAASILFSELFTESGGTLGKEYSQLLPSQDKRQTWSRLAREWQDNEKLREGFLRWSERLEREYDVPAKLTGLDTLVRISGFAAVDQILLDELCARIISEGEGLLKHIDTAKTVARVRKSMIWSKIGKFEAWDAVSAAVDLFSQCLSAEYSTKELVVGSLDDFVARYVAEDGWWRIDKLYRLMASHQNMKESVRTLFVGPATLAYFNWLTSISSKFSDAVSRLQMWESKEALNQKGFWKSAVGTRDDQVAVLLIDAMRYDLYQDLAETLQKKGYHVETRPVLASLPSITEIGMVALLPNEIGLGVAVREGELHVSLDGSPIESRSQRRDWLKSKLTKPSTFLELDEIITSEKEILKSKVKDFKRIVVMDRDIDKAGTFLSDVTVSFFDDLTERVATAIDKLHKLGVERVVVGTDHGFLLIPKRYKLDSIGEVKTKGDTVKSKRYILGKPPKNDAFISHSFKTIGLSGDGLAMFPRGLTVVKTEGGTETFLHGGISLQEDCVAMLLSIPEVPLGEGKVILQADLPEALTTAIFVVNITPSPKSGKEVSRSIRVDIYSERDLIAQSDILIMHKEPQKARIILRKTPPRIEVQVVDVESKEILIKKFVEVRLEGYDEAL